MKKAFQRKRNNQLLKGQVKERLRTDSIDLAMLGSKGLINGLKRDWGKELHSMS